MKIITIIFPALLILFASCGNKKAEQTRAELTAAAQTGREIALTLAPSDHLDSIAVEHTLIEVRVREGALRREGADNVADAYIEAFLATLDSVNPGLHALLTDPLPDTVAIDRP